MGVYKNRIYFGYNVLKCFLLLYEIIKNEMFKILDVCAVDMVNMYIVPCFLHKLIQYVEPTCWLSCLGLGWVDQSLTLSP
jgi:hypothetical protein